MQLLPAWKPLEVEGHDLIGIARSAFVDDAARLMSEKGIGALGVYTTDKARLVGIITERDVTRCVAQGLDPSETHVSVVMSAHPVGVVGHVTRAEAEKIMRAGHVRHLIVREDGKYEIISLRDI
jgi:CBS domain-containing protein